MYITKGQDEKDWGRLTSAKREIYGISLLEPFKTNMMLLVCSVSEDSEIWTKCKVMKQKVIRKCKSRGLGSIQSHNLPTRRRERRKPRAWTLQHSWNNVDTQQQSAQVWASYTTAGNQTEHMSTNLTPTVHSGGGLIMWVLQLHGPGYLLVTELTMKPDSSVTIKST